jgi:CubicO group peptidase (beta-lactamase class C family)
VAKLISATHSGRGPGSSVVIRQNGKVTLSVVHGLADTATGRPLTQSSVFYVGSIAKEFTAACVALLTFDGAFDFDAPLSYFFPDLPPWANSVTVVQLSHHTSGLPTPYGMQRSGATNEEILPTLRTLKSPITAPGTTYEYSGAFAILAEVVRMAAGAPLADFASERIFKPLGMTKTLFRDRCDVEVPAAAARHPEPGDWRAPHHDPATNFCVVGDGGLWTTAHDMALWDANFDDDCLGDGRLPAALRTAGRLSEGGSIPYGRGLDLQAHRGLRMEGHSGSLAGWSAQHLRFPDQRLSVIWLSNSTMIDTRRLALSAADAYLGLAPDTDARPS